MTTEELPHIIFVESDLVLAEVYCTAFHQAGFDVTHLDNGTHVYAEVEKYVPDAIVLDLFLPHTDGYALVQSIKQHPRLRHIPIILLTSFGQKDDVEKGLSLDVHEYFITSHTKPKDVIRRLQKILSLLE
jgi:CheY-like chemotaxis protein